MTFKIEREGRAPVGGFPSVEAAVDSLRDEFPDLAYDWSPRSAGVWPTRAAYEPDTKAQSDSRRVAVITPE